MAYLCSRAAWDVREVRHPAGPHFDRERSHERQGIGVTRCLQESGHAKDADSNDRKPADLETSWNRRPLRHVKCRFQGTPAPPMTVFQLPISPQRLPSFPVRVALSGLRGSLVVGDDIPIASVVEAVSPPELYHPGGGRPRPEGNRPATHPMTSRAVNMYRAVCHSTCSRSFLLSGRHASPRSCHSILEDAMSGHLLASDNPLANEARCTPPRRTERLGPKTHTVGEGPRLPDPDRTTWRVLGASPSDRVPGGAPVPKPQDGDPRTP